MGREVSFPLDSKPDLESVRETQRRLKVSKQTVYALLRAGELESITIGVARRVVSASVDAYIERRLAS